MPNFILLQRIQLKKKTLKRGVLSIVNLIVLIHFNNQAVATRRLREKVFFLSLE